MRKSLRVVSMLGLAALTLASCAKALTYDEYKAETDKIEAHTYKSCKSSGSYKAKSGNTTTDVSGDQCKFEFTLSIAGLWAPAKTSDLGNADALAIAGVANLKAGNVANVDGAKYYAGNSFKFVDGSDTYEFNKYGYITKYTVDSKEDNGDYVKAKLTFSWSD